MWAAPARPPYFSGHMKPGTLLREPWPRVIGIPVLGFLLTFVFNEPPYVPYHFVKSILIVGVMWQGDYLIMMALRKRWPGLEVTGRRIGFSVVGLLVYNSLMDFGLCTGLDLIGLEENGSWIDYWTTDIGSKLIPNLAVTFLVATIYEAGYFFHQWRRQIQLTEAIKGQQVRAELNALKDQLSPHFLFNSLNTLVTLIHEDPAQAARFTQKLSEVYRYILQHKDKEVVDLGTELAFTRSYNYLLGMRFERSLDVRIDIDPALHGRLVAPLTLQMLVENAVKHNTASLSHPLRVDIYAENGRSLIVRNTLRRKSGVPEGTGTGLENIRQRYSYLSDRPVDVIETREHFLVALPLIELAAPGETVTGA